MADHLAAPTLLDEHRKLAAFAGEWSGEEMVYPSRWTEGGPATSKVNARIDLTITDEPPLAQAMVIISAVPAEPTS